MDHCQLERRRTSHRKHVFRYVTPIGIVYSRVEMCVRMAVSKRVTRPTKARRVEGTQHNTSILFTFGDIDSDDGLFNPSDVAVGMNGEVYVVDSSNDRIQRFSGDGQFELKWGRKGSGKGEFKGPTGIAVIPVSSSRKSILGALGAVAELSIFHPGIVPICATYVGDRIYVTELGNHRIQVFTSTGEFLQFWGTRGRTGWPVSTPSRYM